METLEELQTHGGSIISLVRPLPDHELMISIMAHNIVIRHNFSDVRFEFAEMRSEEYILQLTDIEANEIKRWLSIYAPVSYFVDIAWLIASRCTREQHPELANVVAEALIRVIRTNDLLQLNRLALVLLGTRLNFSTLVLALKAKLTEWKCLDLTEQEKANVITINQTLDRLLANPTDQFLKEKILSIVADVLVSAVQQDRFCYLDMVNHGAIWECNIAAEHVLEVLYDS
ncbi:hypothetical protein HUO09_17640 [Vibrio sp. Y2-5]|uniref:hypothetical protein n=1 Tax=Vibrio sp. Y2-5 TaxID=2743977 RepID=UPI001661863D|nr:hypothetical protein [Vibrio sp. Y2-5]MBD0788181.1 hypothetical protein [Vibrio sp. Y2-5]